MAITPRKRKDGSLAYGVTVYVDGSHKWVGTASTKTEARELEANASVRSPLTFRAFADEWMATRSQLRPNTLARYRHAAALAAARFGDTPLETIDNRACENYMAWLNDRYAPQSANVHFDVFRSMLKTAHKWGLAPEPMEIGNRPRRRNTREIHPLTPSEHQALVAATGRWYRPLVAFWPLVGLRFGEMAALSWSDIEGDALKVRKGKTDAAVRTIALMPEAVEILAGLERPTPLVFTNTLLNPLIPSVTRTVLATAARNAGIPHVTPHDMRHTFATWMIYSGANPKTLQKLLGHENIELTLNRYSHYMPEQDVEAVVSMGEWKHSSA